MNANIEEGIKNPITDNTDFESYSIFHLFNRSGASSKTEKSRNFEASVMRLCGRIPFLIPLKDGKPNGSGVLHSTNGKRTSIDFSEIKNLLFKKLEEPVDIVWEGSVFVFPGESKSLNSSKISSRFNKEHALGQLLRELGVDLLETVVGIQPSLLGRACYFGDLQVLEYSVRLYAKKASS